MAPSDEHEHGNQIQDDLLREEQSANAENRSDKSTGSRDSSTTPANHVTAPQSKYGVSFGEGQAPIHIGDHIGDRVYEFDQEDFRRILKEELWSTEYRQDAEVMRTILREELRLPNKNYAATVNSGLNALSELLRDPAVFRSATAFRVDFESVCDRIATISQLKNLHDLLHTIEVGCYKLMSQDADAFPDNRVVAQDMAMHHIDFQTQLMRIQLVCDYSSTCLNDVIWVSSLRNAEQQLDEAVATLSGQKLKQALHQIYRVIANQPSRINTQLTSSARVLRLSELTKSLSSIKIQLSNSDVDAQKVEIFGQGITALVDLDNRLTSLVTIHDYWQLMDTELRAVEADLSQSFAFLETAWPDIQNRFKPVFEGAQDDWVVLFEKDTQNLGAAITENNPAEMRQCFRLYRRRTLARFYEVDFTLKLLCDELSKVGEKLAAVLEVLS